MVRRELKWLHRWLGIILGLVISIITLSGSWLIYERELNDPPYRLNSSHPVLPLQMLLERALEALPGNSDIHVRMPQRKDRAYQFWAGTEVSAQVVIDQYTGEILAKRTPDFWPYGWIFELHSELLSGKMGEEIAGWIGVCFLAVATTGIILWWPRNWRNIWQLRLSRGQYITHHDLHGQFGILAAPALIVAAVTGISLCFSTFTDNMLNSLFNNKPANAPKISEVDIGYPRCSLDKLVNAAELALPGGRIGVILIPAAPNKPVVMRKQLAGEPHPNGLNFIYLNPYTAEVMKLIPLSQAGAGKKWFNWAYPLHMGQAFNSWHQWLLLVSGLIPTLLLVTGLTMYLLRRQLTVQRNSVVKPPQ